MFKDFGGVPLILSIVFSATLTGTTEATVHGMNTCTADYEYTAAVGSGKRLVTADGGGGEGMNM